MNISVNRDAMGIERIVGICRTIEQTNPRAICYLVGGAIRDYVLYEKWGILERYAIGDYDIEVHNVSIQQIIDIVSANSAFYKVDLIGQRFGIVQAYGDGLEVQFAIPRREVANGIGHKDFSITLCPDMGIREACRRRDFTCNALAIPVLPENGEYILDFFGGIQDIYDGVLRPISSNTFIEDSGRLFRAVYLAQKCDLMISTEIDDIGSNMVPGIAEISSEAMYSYWYKIFTTRCMLDDQYKPHRLNEGIAMLVKAKAMPPSFMAMETCVQDAIHHPECFVLTHIFMVVAQMMYEFNHNPTEFTKDEQFMLLISALLHDIGKTIATEERWSDKYNRMVITSYDHQTLGLPLVTEMLEWMGISVMGKDMVPGILALVEFHMHHIFIKNGKKAAIMKLADMLDRGNINIHLLTTLWMADVSGRATPPEVRSADINYIRKVQAIANWLGCYESRPNPLVMGRDVLEYTDMKPGPQIGDILRSIRNMQLDGKLQTRADAIYEIVKMAAYVNATMVMDWGITPGPNIGKVLRIGYSLQASGYDKATVVSECEKACKIILYEM